MPGPVLVGVDGAGAEATNLGRMLAELTGAPLALGSIYGFESASPVWPPREEAEAWIAAARPGPDDCAHLMLASSVAGGLDALAAREGAQILVLGSSSRGPLGRLLARSTARRVIQGAPCAVAVAPRGWRTPDTPSTILVADRDRRG